MAAPASDAHIGTTSDLVPFIPRLTLEWLRDSPEQRWLELEGTLAFIDISGFTAMSERLSSQGRAGAEEVTDVMNATFEALLEVAYAEGGGLLKFGGDALLLLYDEEDHAPRAARAAFEMRRTLRAIGRPRTSAGAVQLKMHAGLHTGRFQFFLVGESHRELLITGPAASRTVEMEAASEAGEILLSPETAKLLHADTLGEGKGPGRLLRAAPDIRGELVPLPDVEGLPIELAVPAPLRAQLLEVGRLEGEHRQAAIGFIRYGGIDEVIATEGPEAAAEALEVLTRTVQVAADEHQVTFLESDVDKDGGRIVLVSGAPQTFGDVEERLLRTLRAIVDAGLPLPVNIGVSEGRVFTGQVGASFRRTYTVLGDTAALAARLMARAGEDEIWVSAGAVARGGSSFNTTELEPLTLKGKSEPVPAFVLGNLLAEADRSKSAPSEEKLPFFDRERERAVLSASVAPVRMGFGTLVELVGEPGIGKSRLAEELRENCADMRRIELRCEQYEASTPYHPFRPFLRSLLDVELNGGGEHNRAVLDARLETIDGELVPWTPLLAAPLDVQVESTPEVDSLDPAFWRARLHGVMGTLLGHLLDSPTLFVFDDVHWMDDASSELLRHLATQLPTRPWLACTTRRPGDGGFTAAEGTPPLPALTLRLEPLPEADAKALAVAAAGDRRLTDDELAALIERGAGNPLFLRELASVGDTTEDAEDLPDTVEALVATRVDQLAPGDRALLRWASVLGERFSGSLIAEVLEDDPNVAAASEAWDRLAEFVERDPDVPGGFRFRHALIRDAAYEGLSYKRRRELHGRVAEVIEQRHGDEAGDVAELLSLHYFNAGRWPAAWRFSLSAADQARDIYANADAASFYERAISAGKRVERLDAAELAGVWRELGLVRERNGEYAEAGEALASAIALLEDPVAKAEIYELRARVRYRSGDLPKALRDTTTGLKLVESDESGSAVTAQAALLARRASVRFAQGRNQRAISIATRAVAAAESVDAKAALAYAFRVLDASYAQHGDPDKDFYAVKALELFRELGMLLPAAITEMNIGVNAYARGDWDEALTRYMRSQEELERLGDHANAGFTGANLGELLVSRGMLEDADRVLRDAREALTSSGVPFAVILADLQIARLEAARGNPQAAVEICLAAIDEASSKGFSDLLLEAKIHLASAHVAAGEPERALDVLGHSGDVAVDEDRAYLRAPLARVKARALMELGRLDEAADLLARALSEAQGQRLAYEEFLARVARCELSRLKGSQDAEELQEAQRLQQLLGISSEIA